MSTAAAGNRALVGLAREARFNQPDPAQEFIYLRPILPGDFGLEHPSAESGEVNQSGYLEKRVPGAVSGPINLGFRFSAATILEILEHKFGKVTKTEPETGIFHYLYEPVRVGDGLDTSFNAIYGLPPVESGQLTGIKFSQMAMAIGNNTAIPCRLTGLASHGTPLGVAVPDVANTGTYTKGPLIRGLPKNRTLPIFVKVTRVVGGLQFKTHQIASSPTFPGSAVDVVLDPVTALGDYQNLVGHTGLDLGYWDENKDPLEICWPGSATDHGDLAVGDIFEFPVEVALPETITYIGGQRMTSAHWVNEVRAIGGSTWEQFRALTGTLTMLRAVTADGGSGSKYPYGLDRDGVLTPTLQFARRYNSAKFLDYARQHDNFEMRTSFLGQQLSASRRESIVFNWASVGIASRAAAIQNANAIQETVTLRGETNDDGDYPLTVEVITDRDYTPAT